MNVKDDERPERVGRYQIEAELGRGAMGVVYRARDPRLDRLVALKTLQPQVPVEPEMVDEVRQRFLNEGRAAGRLSHPAIVGVYDADEDEESGLAYIAMEFVEGPDLKPLLVRGADPERVVAVVRDVAAALDHAHSKGVIHRDVKPANVLVDADGRARLTDFGIARLASSTMTQDGQFLGSPSYMSPEQVRGWPVTEASDIFSLAVIAYEGLTGKRPFQGTDLASMTYTIANEDPVPPSKVRPSLPAAVDEVLRRALSKKSPDRFATATAFADALADALEGKGGAVAGAGVGGRRRALIAGAALVLVGVIAGTAALVGRGDAGSVAERTPPGDAVSTASASDAAAAGDAAAEPRRDDGEPAPEEPTPVAAPVGGDGGPAGETPIPPPEPTPEELASDAVQRRAPVSESPQPVAVAGEGYLRVDVYTFRDGRLTVLDEGRIVGRRDVEKLRKRKFRLKNPKRHFQMTVPVTAGRRTLTFRFDVEDGKSLSRTAVRDVAPGATLGVTVDIGTLGKDIDVRF